MSGHVSAAAAGRRLRARALGPLVEVGVPVLGAPLQHAAAALEKPQLQLLWFSLLPRQLIWCTLLRLCSECLGC